MSYEKTSAYLAAFYDALYNALPENRKTDEVREHFSQTQAGVIEVLTELSISDDRGHELFTAIAPQGETGAKTKDIMDMIVRINKAHFAVDAARHDGKQSDEIATLVNDALEGKAVIRFRL